MSPIPRAVAYPSQSGLALGWPVMGAPGRKLLVHKRYHRRIARFAPISRPKGRPPSGCGRGGPPHPQLLVSPEVSKSFKELQFIAAHPRDSRLRKVGRLARGPSSRQDRPLGPPPGPPLRFGLFPRKARFPPPLLPGGPRAVPDVRASDSLGARPRGVCATWNPEAVLRSSARKLR